MNRLWWLSFADTDGFRGVCLIEAATMRDAVRVAHLLGCNPGGEVVGQEIPEDDADNRSLPRGQLLTQDFLWSVARGHRAGPWSR